jgi:hypothetical protein
MSAIRIITRVDSILAMLQPAFDVLPQHCKGYVQNVRNAAS